MSDEYRRVLHEWARRKCDDMRTRHGQPTYDIGRVVKVEFDYEHGGPLSEVTYEDSHLNVIVTWIDSNGRENYAWVMSDPDEVAIEMGKLLNELLALAEEGTT